MNDTKDHAQTLFLNALEFPSAEERAAYLDAHCGVESELRKEVDELLDHARRLGPFLEPAEGVADSTTTLAITECPGTIIGPYKLLQQIGEGGMGIVFMAEQSEPIQRSVALKIIKPGMDTRQVIARFEAERQALAMMDHPNIARVLDAGTTDTGRPYFVMELVKGVPITKYCDEKHLPLRARLELFVPVCQAVQHAHQKGIIHRDIKPNNVLVAEYDNRAMPKVIDFGVAKATAQKLTECTMFTEFGQLVGTMEYMSPEQAKLNQLDVDTRSDIYSLGVLLYELLAGSTPFEGKRLHAAAFDEMLRIIREEEPPKPSTRLSTSDALPSIAANRNSEPQKLGGLLKGELDWVAMKALEKDRNQRYETASAFAADIERHLRDEPVQACPPSAMYRFRKFARRNRTALLIATAAIATLLLLVVGLAVSNRMIAAERDEKAQALAEKEQALALAEAQRQLAYYMDSMLHSRKAAGTGEMDDLYRGVSALLDRAAALPSVPQPLGAVPLVASIGHRQRDLAFILQNAGRREEAETMFRKAVGTFEKLREQNPGNIEHWHFLADTHCRVGRVAIDRNKPQQAEQEFRKAIEIHEQRVEKFPHEQVNDLEWASAYFDLARLLIKHDRPQEAAALIARGIEVFPKNQEAADKLQGKILLANLLREAGDIDRALTTFSEVIASQPDEEEAWVGRGKCYLERGEFDKAIEQFSAAVKLQPQHGDAWNGRAWAHFHLQHWNNAVDDYSKAIECSPDVHTNWYTRGYAYLNLAQWDKAAADFTRAVDGWPNDPGGWYMRALAYAQLNQPEKAITDLRQATAKGFKDAEQLKNEPKLAPLRSNDGFKKLLTELEGEKK